MMKRLAYTTGTALCAFALVAGSVYAKSADRHGPVQFETLDRDGDGQITREEMAAQRGDRFEEADTDGDGKLSLAEIEARAAARAKERAGKLMTRLDSDGDGFVSADEMQPGPRADRRFDRADSDGNGAISKVEFESAKNHMKGRRGQIE